MGAVANHQDAREKAKQELRNIDELTLDIGIEIKAVVGSTQYQSMNLLAISYIVHKVLDKVYDPNVIGGTIYDHVVHALLELGSDAK